MARRSSIAFGDLLQGQGEVEDLARVDPAREDQVDQVGQVAAYGGGAAAQADVGEEQLLAVDRHVAGDADEADVAAGAGRAQGLLHAWGADALQHTVGADTFGEVLDAGDTFLAALGDDVVAPNSRASFWRDAWRLMAMIRSAPSCLAESTASSPTAPSPTTATVPPGRTSAQTAAWWPVDMTSERVSSEASIASEWPEPGTGTSAPSASGTRTASPWPPSPLAG